MVLVESVLVESSLPMNRKRGFPVLGLKGGTAAPSQASGVVSPVLLVPSSLSSCGRSGTHGCTILARPQHGAVHRGNMDAATCSPIDGHEQQARANQPRFMARATEFAASLGDNISMCAGSISLLLCLFKLAHPSQTSFCELCAWAVIVHSLTTNTFYWLCRRLVVLQDHSATADPSQQPYKVLCTGRVRAILAL